MASSTAADGFGSSLKLRAAAWGGAAALIFLPLLTIPNEIEWRPSLAAFATGLLVIVGIAFEAALRISQRNTYRAGMALGVATALFLAWANLAVGVIGSEDNPANLMYFGVIAVAVGGAFLSRFRAEGMQVAFAATAMAQVLVFVVALVAGFGFTGPITVFFSGLWLISAWLFRRSAQARLQHQFQGE